MEHGKSVLGGNSLCGCLGEGYAGLSSAARQLECLIRAGQQEVGVGMVLLIAPGSVAILETNWEQGKNLMEVLSINWGGGQNICPNMSLKKGPFKKEGS